ncbi:MAG: hypothetical protein KME08_02180 [Aphanothece sp. CMT-3BRIN-NPC111]|jgi:hypothetical protein|nr:hypothetical protein [Aphanothece sp. CMT-3BRIN-NPC111]
MSSSQVEKLSRYPSILAVETVVYTGILWAVLALLFFLLFSIPVPGEKRSLWYLIGTYIFEQMPFILAALLCFRNWGSPNIASGRNVWLRIGLAMLSLFIGKLLFGWWEMYWGLAPDVSPGSLFYIAFYLFLSWGMVLVLLPRRLNLEIWQWVIVAAIAAGGVALGVWVSTSTPPTSQESPAAVSKSAIVQVSPVASPKKRTALKAPTVKPTVKQVISAATKPALQKPPTDSTSENQPPAWALSLEKKLTPLSPPLSWFYVICDVFLLIISALLLLAFWGGRFAQSWRMIAAAAFSLYIADMWFNYAQNNIPDYQRGFILEVFWVFSGVLFAIGAALEYDTSSRARRSGRRRA